jgi:hypothetical protein
MPLASALLQQDDLSVYGKKERREKDRREGAVEPDAPMWSSDEGVHALAFGQPPTASQVASMTTAYQQQIRDSPLWDQMVKKFGEQKAAEMLKQFTVKIDERA